MADKTQADTAKPALKAQRNGRRNFNALHAQLLPLKVHPLPTLIPQNPISILYLAYTYVRQILYPPSSHPETPYYGYFSSETSSVHVTNRVGVRAFWEHGFFGKGSLSRSEPNWMNREKIRRGLIAGETSEEITRKRREERKVFKTERARKLREEIENKLKEETKLGKTSLEVTQNGAPAEEAMKSEETVEPPNAGAVLESAIAGDSEGVTQLINAQETPVDEEPDLAAAELEADEVEITNQEHLQLDLCEAFFLQYALGVLAVLSPTTQQPISNSQLFRLFSSHAAFPPTPSQQPPAPDNKFMLNYIAYHHFRSLGWIVRTGLKFSVDLLLYNRGPVFSHAEFAVVIIPAFSHPYWKKDGRSHVEAKGMSKQWHWLHMVNRVQSQVRKTLVLCFIEVPPPWTDEVADGYVKDVGAVMKKYKVREMILKRWVPNRSRD